MLTHSRSRRRAALAACAAALTTIFVLAAAPVQASATSAPVQKRTTAKPAVPAAVNPPHVRRACAAPRRGHAACMALIRTNVPGHRGLFTAGATPAGYGPSDLRSAYDLPSATTGSGQTVAIVDAYDDPTAEADLQAYRAQYGLPPCTTANGCFEKVNQDGQQGSYPEPDSGWAGEESLDLDMVSAICPNCHIILVEANSNQNGDLYTAEDEAVALGAKYVSNSWGGAEDPSELQADQQSFNHPGVAITASAGDAGYGTEYPAASQYVTSVGGTSLTRAPGTARGWTETAWGGAGGGQGTGSGCSVVEPKPSWQTDTGCANRTIADVSADANPTTGVAVYDSYGDPGWEVFGGTSVAAPIIASTYALAGPPATGYPSSLPYAYPQGLNDVTSGVNGTCTPAYLCTAGPGYDAPTGLGTPHGLVAFSSGPHGQITGRVTAKGSGKPVAGVSVSTTEGWGGDYDAQGEYDLGVLAGSYDLTATEFGYKPGTAAGVTVGGGQTATENFTLAAIPRHTLSGTVTDGSGHGWPLYAAITVPGDPDTPVYTEPYTGAYHLSLPRGATYKVQVTPVSPGYNVKSVSVRIGTADLTRNFTATPNTSSCMAPGYTWTHGLAQDFHAVGTVPPPGWQVSDNIGDGYQWTFNDPVARGNRTGGRGGFAIADDGSSLGRQDTTLTSPAFSLAGVTAPVLSFDTDYQDGQPGSASDFAEVDSSTDAGHTWSSIWHNTTGVSPRTTEQIPIHQATGDSQVRVRFHLVGNDQNLGSRKKGFWEVDNVAVGTTPVCAALAGGLVAGQVHDGNSGHPVDGATVTSVSSPAQSAATANSVGAGDGFYELFAPGTGAQKFTAADGNYTPATQNAAVTANTVTRRDFTLQAGKLTVSARSVSAAVTMGQAAQRTVRLTNDGTRPVHVSLSPLDSGYAPPGQAVRQAGAPVQRIKVHAVPGPMTAQPGSAAPAAAPGVRLLQPTASDGPWTDIADYPVPIEGNAVAYDPRSGDVYSFNGFSWPGNVNLGYVYDPGTQQWNPTASAPIATEQSKAAIVGGTAYLIGGWNNANQASPLVYAYNIARNTWSKAASLPAGAAAIGVAVLNGQIYVVGGCADGPCDHTASVYRYDPSGNTWTQLASYPVNVAYPACSGIDSEVVCAGGTQQNVSLRSNRTIASTYIYHPASNTWTAGADMPYDNWGMAYGGANGKLQVADGISTGALVNLAAQYDPATNTWAALPNTNIPAYRSGSACGLYQIGGINLDANNLLGERPFAQVLPGYDQCGSTAPGWLSQSGTSYTLAPGASATVTLTLNSARLTQPGTYTASLAVGTDTPYEVSPIPVSLKVSPPATWGELTGTVTSAATGQPVPGATVQVCTRYNKGTGTCPTEAATYTLKTDDNGGYQLWLARPLQANPLQVIVARQGFAAQARLVKLTAGTATTASFALSETSASTRRGVRHLSG